ncbi:hypothetical protein C7999DRAFT_12196 [Corynascus novoguineensis]|uniref:Uncharacterized protein n=1 Tax=Corynascus novoguineensis TaxID=1126955 RepID=A0AAN7HHG3_9PEZI|nr:hypothetical protein C7999DRAFT_12196 [Corynascus novoguineensis]
MGNESSRPEHPEGRSRSLSPLPRDDQLLPDDDDSLPPPPSTMPASLVTADGGSAPPGAPGSLAWHRRRRRARGVSPELRLSSSSSNFSEDQHPIDSQPLGFTDQPPSSREFSQAETQPARSKSKHSRRSYLEKNKKAELEEAAEAAHNEALVAEAVKQESRKRKRRSVAPSPFIRQNEGQAASDFVSADGLADMALTQSPPPKRARLNKKDEVKKKVDTKNPGEKEATSVNGSSISDTDDEPPPSPQLRDKRFRRKSDPKARNEPKLGRSPNVEPDNGPGTSDELIEELAADRTNGLSRLDDNGMRNESGDDTTRGTRPQSPLLEEHITDEEVTRRPSRSDHGSQRSHFDSGHAESDTQNRFLKKSGLDLMIPNGSPHLKGDDQFAANGQTSQDGDDNMSAVSESQGLLATSSTPVSPTYLAVGDRKLSSRTVENSPGQHKSDRALTPTEPLDKSPGPRSSAKRKTKVPFFSRQEENGQLATDLPHDDVGSQPVPRRCSGVQSPVSGEAGRSASARKSKSNKPKRRVVAGTAVTADEPDAQVNREESQYSSGPLTRSEVNQIIRAVERFREDEDLTQEELNQIIHDNPQKSTRPIHRQFWASIQDACPSRPRRRLIEWCRQRFNNWAGRGTWTREQDDELADLVAKHGKKWSFIAGLINRYQKDVRDRWRNYLVCRDTVRTDAWSDSEEERFRELVQRSIEKIREGLGKDNSKSAEALLNWLDISEAMGHTRSRLQCMEKWKRIRASEPLPDRVPTVLPPGNSWRLEKARADLRKITTYDKYRLTCAIRDSGVKTDAKINWKQIVDGTFQGVFERQAIVVTWGRLRKAVPDWESKTVRDCARHLIEMYESEGDFGIHGLAGAADDSATIPTDKRRRKGNKVTRPTITNKITPSVQSATAGAQSNEVDVTSPVANKENLPTLRESRSKHGKQKSKKAREISPDLYEEPADGDIKMEGSALAGSHANPSAGNGPSQTESVLNPELDAEQPQSSPSVEAEAARSRRRERRGSTAEIQSANGKDKEAQTPASKVRSSKILKRQRHEPLSNGNTKGLKSSRWKTLSSSEVDGIIPASADEGRALKSNGKSWSVVSSDMDDMEDIPATLPVSG